MNSYEMIFFVAGEVSDEQQQDMLEELDVTFSRTHEHTTLVMGNFGGHDCVEAAKTAVRELRTRGLGALRMQEDLVTRSEMAFRLDVTRQTVTHWASGTRRSRFPPPNRDTAQGLWLWGDVMTWMQGQPEGYETFGTSWPTQEDHDLVNGWLARSRHVDHVVEPPAVLHRGPRGLRDQHG